MNNPTDLKNQIIDLKNKRKAVILAHYYVDDDIQDIADYIGDSFYLSKIASTLDSDVIVMCGVSFMGESVKILNPDKLILLPDETADCPMAHMATPEQIEDVRSKYTDLAVVCYINSSATLKSYSDVCVTSANALTIVKKLPQKNILFIPDNNLGSYAAGNIPDKNFIFLNGCCPVHNNISAMEVLAKKKKNPYSFILTHPECSKEILEISDYIGSTSQIIDYATNHPGKSFLICTENGVLHELKKRNPDKEFICASNNLCCADMKKITLQKVLNCLQNNTYEVTVPEELREASLVPLKRMLELAK